MAGSDVLASGGMHELAKKFLRQSLSNRVVAGAAGILASRVAFHGLSFIQGVMLARILGVSGLGFYTYSFSWVVLLTIPGMLGMDQLLVREIAASSSQAASGSIRSLLHKANQVVLLSSLGLVFIGGLVSWALARRTDPQLHATFLAALLLLPLITLTRIRQCALQGLHRVVLAALPEMVIQPVVLVAFLGIAFRLGGSQLTAPRAMGLNVMSCLIAFLIGAGLLLSNLPKRVEETAPKRRHWNWGKSALSLMFLASIGVIYGQTDNLMLGAIKGAKAVGIYGVADRGSDLVMIFLMVVTSALTPTIASLYASRDIQRLERVVIKFARVTFLLSLPVALAFIAFGYWYLKFFYGVVFTAGRQALTILVVGKVLTTAMGEPGMILIMTGHERDAARAIGLSALITILLNLVLIPLWGLEGTAVATASTTVLWNVLMVMLLHKRLGIHCTALGRISFRQASEA